VRVAIIARITRGLGANMPEEKKASDQRCSENGKNLDRFTGSKIHLTSIIPTDLNNPVGAECIELSEIVGGTTARQE
jgi:hypothetical protein